MANHRSRISSWVAFVYKNTNRIYHEGSEAALSHGSLKLVLSAGPAVSYTIRKVWREEPCGNTSCLSWTHLRGNRYHKQHMVGLTLSSSLALSMGIRGKRPSDSEHKLTFITNWRRKILLLCKYITCCHQLSLWKLNEFFNKKKQVPYNVFCDILFCIPYRAHSHDCLE